MTILKEIAIVILAILASFFWLVAIVGISVALIVTGKEAYEDFQAWRERRRLARLMEFGSGK